MRYIALILILSFTLSVSACSKQVSFPGEMVTDAVEEICKLNYDLDVTSIIQGETLGVMFYEERLVDDEGKMDAELMQDTLGDLILSITRVALSTDRKIYFIVVAVRGRQDENEIRIIRNLIDIKKAQTEALSVEESLSRTLWVQTKFKPSPLNPREFPLENITLEDFLAKQIVQRIRFDQQRGSEDTSGLPTELLDGKYISSIKENIYEFSIISFEAVAPERNVVRVLKMANTVFKGYRYYNFDRVVIKDLLGRKVLNLDRETYDDYRLKKITEEQLLRTSLRDDMGDSDRLKNALEIFGFNM
jgi:hypothetical protein